MSDPHPSPPDPPSHRPGQGNTPEPGGDTREPRRFAELIGDLLDGELDAGGRARLAELVDTIPAARASFVAHCQLHALLTFEHGLLAGLVPEAELPAARPVAVPGVAATPAAAPSRAVPAAAAAFVAGGLFLAGAIAFTERGAGGALPVIAGADPAPAAIAPSPPLSPGPGLAPPPVATPEGTGSLNRPPAKVSSALTKVSFNRDIRPLLSDNCFQCHGPDEKQRKADVRLDVEEVLFAQPEDARALPLVTRFRPDQSEIFYRITTGDEDDVMPPPDSHKSLTDPQKDLFKRWIEEGARWEEHWAFIAPRKPSTPEVEDAAWPKNTIDQFVLAELERRGLGPSPEADPVTLARRISLDLTGLPPEPATVDRFADAYRQNPDAAVEGFADELLASPSFGEHRARYWLDAARYGDTHGLHLDNYREAWPYRDWVVDAFNRNLPFDAFTIEQLAGDLLPEATPDQRVATGFNRCNVTTSEGGAIAEEFAARYAADRVETTSAVWLGLTTGCAACHDHKFDPVTQKDFYSLVAFFNNTTQPAMDGNSKETPPVMTVYPNGGHQRLSAIKDELATLQPATDAAQGPPHFTPTHRLVAHAPLTTARATDLNADPADPPAPAGGGLRFTPESSADLGDVAKLSEGTPFTLALWVKTEAEGTPLVAKTDHSAGQLRGYEITIEGGKPLARFSHFGRNDGSDFHAEAAVNDGAWHHVAVASPGRLTEHAVRIYVDGKRVPSPARMDALFGTVATSAPLVLRTGKDDVSLADFRAYDRLLAPSEIAALAKRPAPLDTAALARADALELELAEIENTAAFTLVMAEKPDTPATAHVLERGEYDKPGEMVTPSIPAVLPPLGDGEPPNRLGLARWLVRPDHPLTARVTTNRFWQQVFGTGIVKTPEDFGVQGEPPSHPELLDFLAVDFVESGWDVKRFFRNLVVSATYRQRSHPTPELREADPSNRFLTRGPRFRLDAEALRDQALFASGLLNPERGGPGVRPYQPQGIWKAVGYTGSNTVAFTQDHGPDLYRRSLYTFWKRTAPPPSMVIFDAPSRESCTLRRERTNTPLQALVLMNDPQFVEAARKLAERALNHPDPSADAVTTMHRIVLGKPPRPKDATVFASSLDAFLTHYQNHPDAARALSATGESPPPPPALDPATVAAHTMVASQILNLDEVVNKN